MNGPAATRAELAPPLLTSTEALDWLEEAGKLEDEILRQARRTAGGEVIWFDPSSLRKEERQPSRLGPYLYDGLTGVALFLAAMEHIEPREGRRDCIFAALASLRRRLQALAAHPPAASDQPLDLGGFVGLGGYIYAFVLMGRWLGEAALIAEAAEIATRLTADRIAADEALDVMSGCAGAALALLVLDGVSPGALRGEASPLERAVACGEHLLSRRTSIDGAPRAWPAKGRPPRCGFAHGAAGIACCLTRLFARTGVSSFREAAEEGVAFEDLHYDPQHGDWPLLGIPGERFATSWCSGAPGIALGRLGMLALGTGPVRQGLQIALHATVTCSKPTFDSLCCGSMGRAEVLLQCHEVLGEERLLTAAEAIASRVVQQSRERDGRYCWRGPGDARFFPSFFAGAAGVGYTFLRLARPSFLPCVLSLEAV